MKPSISHLVQTVRSKARRALIELRQKCGRQREACARDEIGVGAVVGCSACIALAWSAPPLVVSVAAMLGLCSGAVIGLLLWIASATLPGERIVPPAASEKRGSHPNRRPEH